MGNEFWFLLGMIIGVSMGIGAAGLFLFLVAGADDEYDE